MTRHGGPVFEDVGVGDRIESPAVQVTPGMAAVHQSIVGNRLPLCLDTAVAERRVGYGPLANPSLVWDLSIGCTTELTQEVIANLYYEGLAFHRYPQVGESLTTSTVVVDRKLSRPVEGRPRTGAVLLRVTTRDQQARVVLDFARCALLPSTETDEGARTGWQVGADSTVPPPSDPCAGWRLAELPGWARTAPIEVGQVRRAGGDVVSNAPELARLTMNIARVHHDAPGRSGERLVYGGHTIGLAFAQACRAMPQLVVPLSWESCNHDAAVREGDTVESTHEVVRVRPDPTRGSRVDLVTRATARGTEGPRLVLTWRWRALMAP